MINRKPKLILLHDGKNQVKEKIKLSSRVTVNIGKGEQTDICTVKIPVNTKTE